MKKIVVAISMMFALEASAQVPAVEATSGYFGTLRVLRDSTNTLNNGVVPSLTAQTFVYPESKEWSWNILSQVVSMTDGSNENVATYSQAIKDGKSPVWATVSEARCYNVFGPCYAAELDLIVNGRSSSPNDVRTGILMVVGKVDQEQVVGPAEVTSIFDVMPFGHDNSKVLVNNAFRVFTPCVNNCFQIPSNSTVNLDGGVGDAEIKFDPQTGFIGFWNKRQQKWIKAWNASDGREWK